MIAPVPRAAIEVLLRADANVNRVAGNGVAPVHMAPLLASSADLELLLTYGADIDATTANGDRAIDFAVERNNHDIIATLLNHFASANHHWIDTSGTYSSIMYRAAVYADITTLRLLSDAHLQNIAMDHQAQWNYWNWFDTRSPPVIGEGDPPELLRAAFQELLDSVTPGAVDQIPITRIHPSVRRSPMPGAYPVEDFEEFEDNDIEGGSDDSVDTDHDPQDTNNDSDAECSQGVEDDRLRFRNPWTRNSKRSQQGGDRNCAQGRGARRSSI